MSLFSRVCFASTMFAAMLVSTSFAQPPGRGDRGPGERGQGERGDRGGERRGPGGPEGRRGGGPPPEVMMRAFPVLAALDADHDGKISKTEIENATAALKKLDKNNDGELTAEEMRPDFAAFGPPGGPGGPRGGFGPPEGRGGPPEGRGGPPGGRGGPEGDATAMVDRFMQFDKNEDGKLSKDELSERMQGMIARADTNEDGFATREELEAMASRGMRQRGEGDRGPGGPEGRGGREGDAGQFLSRMFDQRDKNEDGKLSGDEIPEQMAGRLEQIDTDKDGSVSRQEMEAMMRNRGPRDGARGPGEGGGRPGGDRPRRPESE